MVQFVMETIQHLKCLVQLLKDTTLHILKEMDGKQVKGNISHIIKQSIVMIKNP